ncbi:MAG: hypothetical protein EHM40_14410 [Chloroflexi bacterium]|nr:MAG: hypothetical protein EHM40_14410 [Chloroflexota bacterium]
MAKVRSNVIVRGLSGAFGEQIVLRHMRDGSTVVAKMPDFSKRKFSTRQKEHQSRFQQAVAYAKAARGNPIYAEIAAGTLKNAYNVALSDWCNPPVIHTIERSEGYIRIWASDNVMVTKVQLTILDQEGNVVEKGEGVRGEGDLWEYASRAQGQVMAEAWDLAGNRVSLVVE